MSTAAISRNTGCWLLALGASAQLMTAAPAAAQTASSAVSSTTPVTPESTFTHIVEWDIPSAGDIEGGAVVVDTHSKDNNRMWFLTRSGVVKVYRFDPARSLMKGSARWMSWQLSPTTNTGGLQRLKPSDDRRYVFVRTATDLQRVDTQNCTLGTPTTCVLTVWQDKFVDQISTSDLAVDGSNRVFTTASGDVSPNNPSGTAYVQMLTPGLAPAVGVTTARVQVKRWPVGGGAGRCLIAEATSTGGTCLSGVDVFQSKYKNLVYYSEPAGNNIGELNIVTNGVRRWNITQVGAFEPRQLNIDDAGKIWVVTGSGHLVSLDPATNRMTAHQVPPDSDLFGVAPDDDVIGYTKPTGNKIAMLFPKGGPIYVTPSPDTVTPFYESVPVFADLSVADSAPVAPQGKIAPVTITSKDDGVFVEADIQMARCVSGPCGVVNSITPRGITPNRGKAQGTFFYTVGFSADFAGDPSVRIGFARLPHRAKIKHGRDDDDCDEGVNAAAYPGWHDHTAHPDDPDDDGVDSTVDTPTSREDSRTADAAPLGAGQTAEYPLTATSTTTALIASVIADDVLAQTTVQIYNQLGALVASGPSVGGVAVATLPAPGAGVYKVRVTNYGLRSVNITPTVIVREPALP